MPPKKISRRQFLAGSGMAASSLMLQNPLLWLFESITNTAINRAIAAESGITPRKWMDMRFDAAPPRWVYDLILQTSAADATAFSSVVNKGLANKYEETSGRYTSAGYYTTTISGIRFPHLWSNMVPVGAETATRPMADLAANFLNIRGIHTGNPAHAGSQNIHYLPPGSAVSISALSADYSKRPLPAVYYIANSYAFRSATGKATQQAIGANPLPTMMSAFQPGNSVTAIRAREKQVSDYLDGARAQLSADARARHPDSALAKEAMESARELIQTSFGSLDATWTGLRSKYQNIINRTFAKNASGEFTHVLPGVNDKPIGVLGTRDTRYSINEGVVIDTSVTEDLRGIVTPTSTIGTMAQSFALSEFLLTNGLSDSVTVFGGNPRDLIKPYTVDEHFCGVMCSLLINSLFAVAHAGCMLTLIDALKDKGIWNDTIIACGGEFNRCPRPDGSGADHGFQGASLAIYSGAISGPMVLGNIAKNAQPTTYPGAWGHAAAVPEFNAVMDSGNALNTVASLLRVPFAVPARPSLVNGSGSTISATIATGKIV